MGSNQPTYSPIHPTDDSRKNSFWRKLGGGSLSISIMVHSIILVLGIFWIFQIIPQKEQEVDFMPKGGGGGQPGAKSETNMKKRATMTTMNAPRLAAKGANSTFTLPEPDPASAMSSVGALGSTGLSGGLGGSGSGGGKGDGKGKGFGNGMGPGMGGGGGKMNPFGMLDPNANALVGNFYDLKQDSHHRPTGINDDSHREVVKEFIRGGWNERTLEVKYFKAPQKLFQTKVYIPLMPADAAPKAFSCEKEVQPSHWMVVYSGMVTPPKSGTYRFVGGADDILVVRFNGRTVFDHGYSLGTVGLYGAALNIFPVLAGTTRNNELEKKVRGLYPMKIPVTYYQYDSIGVWNRTLSGLAQGADFEARAGSSYPIEILISEVPGGSFGADLMIEEAGATYEKASTGAPILPIFRLDNLLPTGTPTGAPPFDPQGPVWKLVGGNGRPSI